MASSASSAVRPRSRPRRTRSMPIRAGGARWASSTVKINSLPTATRCSFTPCSAPQSQGGRDRRVEKAPASGTAMYWVGRLSPARRRPATSTTWGSETGRSEFLAKSVTPSPRMHRLSHTAVPHDCQHRSSGAETGLSPGPETQAAPSSGCQPERSASRGSLEKISSMGATRPRRFWILSTSRIWSQRTRVATTPLPPARAVRPDRWR
jgi:hypothetical protein